MKTRIFTLIMSLFVATMAFAYDVYDVEIDGIYYNLDKKFGAENGTAEVTYSDIYKNSYSGNIVIPKSIFWNGVTYSVTSIGELAFCLCSSLTSVTIPNSVTSIGDEAFYYCSSLTSVTIPNSVTSIGDYAFYYCYKLKSIDIPNSVNDIGYYAFGDCWGLTSISISNSVTSIGACAFYCTSLTSVTIPNSVTIIRDSTFYGCSTLKSIEIPNSVTMIDDCAFYGCKGLTSIEIPNSVTRIEYYAFENCTGLTSVNISDMAAWCNIEFLFSTSNPLYYAKNLYLNGEKVINLVIPEGVTSIGAYAFFRCTGLTSVKIPNGVGVIWQYAFYSCSSLKSVEIPNSVTFISKDVFDYCDLDTIICHAITPPDAQDAYNNCLLLVPECSLDAYKSHKVWGRFKNIKGFKEYTISTSVNDEKMGVVLGDGIYAGGTEITLTAIANVGYGFVKWSDGNTENPRTIVVTEDLNLTAEFAINQYEVSVTSDENGYVTGSGTYDYGTEVTIEAIANEAYRFVQWSDGNTENPRIMEVTENVELRAEFASNQCEVLVKSNGNGRVVGSGTYNYGTEATIKAIANEGYHFVEWSDGNTENPRTIVVTEDIILTAIFGRVFEFSTSVKGDTMGVVLGIGEYEEGREITLVAKANEGYHFVKWSDGNTENPRIITVPEAITLTAEFAKNQYIVNVTSGENGSVNWVSGLYSHGYKITIIATPKQDYRFVQWSDGNTENPRIMEVTENVELRAEFASNQCEVLVKSNGNGRVVGSGTYNYGTEATIKAIANEGYHFVQWSDGNTENPRTIVVTEDVELMAEFAINQYDVNVAADGNGRVTGFGTYDYGTEVTIEAIANEGYHFVKWSDGNTENPRTIVVTEDVELMAIFEESEDLGEDGYLIKTNPMIICKGYKGEIVVTYNPTLGNAGMVGATECYAHTGLITSKSSDDKDWKYCHSTWRGGEEKYKMKKNGNVWQLTIPNIYEYYECPENVDILKLAFVFNDGPNGNKEGKTEYGGDIFIALVDAPIEIKVVVKSDGNGRVTGSGTYDYGTEVMIEAIANEGYHFVQWSDGNTENPRTIVVVEDIELRAEFEEDVKTLVDNVDESSVMIYVQNGVIHVEGAETDYHVLDAAGRLIYSGRDAQLSLPRGVYVVNVGGEVQKVVI